MGVVQSPKFFPGFYSFTDHFRDSSAHFGSMTLKLSLIVDGIEEAVSELFAGLGLIYQKMEKERSMNETCLRKCFYKNSQ